MHNHQAGSQWGRGVGPLGWAAASCSPPPAACPTGSYGENCQHACLCQHGGTCDPVSGHCTCPEGWAGLACEEGEPGSDRGGGGTREPGWVPQSMLACPPLSVGRDGFLPVGLRCDLLEDRGPRLWVQEAWVGWGSPGPSGCGALLGYCALQSASWGALEPAVSTVADVSMAASVTGPRATVSAQPAGLGTSVRAVSGSDWGLGLWGESRGPRWSPQGAASALLQGGGPREVVPWQVGAGAAVRAPRGPCGMGGGCLALLTPLEQDSALCLISPGAACAEGTFGARCEERCSCRRGANCHHVTGACLCPPGWRGSRCENGEPLGSASTHGASC